ncbi:hypothetical protein GCM10022234_28460 [Aeromicrobium panaciterrae]|uniref:hypothetical protein n=1 Tax=Aeromicrobium panaciterrae TaxID=363861 RepID=UPI0031D9FDFD
MTEHIGANDARQALRAVEDERRRVIDEVDLPRWYWWGLAIAWILLGVATDVGNVWITSAATLLFGALHAAVASRLFSGRHKSSQLSVRASTVGRRLPLILFASILLLAAASIVVGFAVDADGAEHASTIAACFAATAILCGGPTLMASIRRRIA